MPKNGRRRPDTSLKKKKVWTIACIIFICAVAILFRFGIDKYFPLAYQEQISQFTEEFSLKSHGLDEYFVSSVICAESRFNEDAESAKGAVGLMQILPDTGAWAAEIIGIEAYREEMLSDPDVNIRIGCWYLAYLSDMFGNDKEKTLAAYNAGPGNVQEWLVDGELVDIQHTETEEYVVKVEEYYKIYKGLYNDF